MYKNYIKLINHASTQIYNIVKKTPCTRSNLLSKKYNNNIYYKREDLQKIFSFKIRGAYNNILNNNINKKIYACSSGNHGQGVALVGKKLNLNTNIIMPKNTPKIKYDNIKNLGGDIILYGNTFDEAKTYCDNLVNLNDGILIHPFNNKYTIAGQGTIGLELITQINNIDYIFCPIGGGGLISGITIYIKNLFPNIKIIGVQNKGSESMKISIDSNKIIKYNNIDTFVDGTAVSEVGNLTFDIVNNYVDDIIIVDKDCIKSTIIEIFNDIRVIPEPAGCLSTAGMIKYVNENKIKNKNIINIISGANIDINKLTYILNM